MKKGKPRGPVKSANSTKGRFCYGGRKMKDSEWLALLTADLKYVKKLSKKRSFTDQQADHFSFICKRYIKGFHHGLPEDEDIRMLSPKVVDFLKKQIKYFKEFGHGDKESRKFYCFEFRIDSVIKY